VGKRAERIPGGMQHVAAKGKGKGNKTSIPPDAAPSCQRDNHSTGVKGEEGEEEVQPSRGVFGGERGDGFNRRGTAIGRDISLAKQLKWEKRSEYKRSCGR